MIDSDLENFLIEYGIPKSVVDRNTEKIITILNSVDPKTSKKSLHSKIARYLSRPDVLTQVNNFLNSSIKHLIDNMENVSDDVASCRMSICESCEFYDKESVRCNSCGCFLKIKTRWASEKCPIGKWGCQTETRPQIVNNPDKPSDCGCNK